jgi:hypothetical protein
LGRWKTRSNSLSPFAAMARDLIYNYVHQGMPQRELEAMLGTPSEILVPPFNKSALPQTYVYYLGSWSDEGIDDAFVYIDLDGNGEVVKAKIDGH